MISIYLYKTSLDYHT